MTNDEGNETVASRSLIQIVIRASNLFRHSTFGVRHFARGLIAI
jgi:hypothetical protein